LIEYQEIIDKHKQQVSDTHIGYNVIDTDGTAIKMKNEEDTIPPTMY